MKRDLIIIPTAGMSREQWLLHRKKGIGASDVSTILGLNQYKAPIELWYERLDATIEYNLESIAAFMGLYHEDSIADLWQYWDGTQNGMMANYQAGKIIRRCRRINAIVSNPKYPWLFVNLDRIMNKTETRDEGALELKTIAGYEADKWAAGIPTGHVGQLMTQLVVTEFTHGEIATMRDGRQFDVWAFDRMDGLCHQIIERTRIFWESVQRGRELLTIKYDAIRNHNHKLADECQAEIETLEPPPDGSEAYEQFLKDKFKRSLAHIGLIPGTESDFADARELQRLKAKIKELDGKCQLHENRLKRRIGEGTTLDFGARGKVSWSGTPKRLLNKVKE